MTRENRKVQHVSKRKKRIMTTRKRKEEGKGEIDGKKRKRQKERREGRRGEGRERENGGKGRREGEKGIREGLWSVTYSVSWPHVSHQNMFSFPGDTIFGKGRPRCLIIRNANNKRTNFTNTSFGVGMPRHMRGGSGFTLVHAHRARLLVLPDTESVLEC